MLSAAAVSRGYGGHGRGRIEVLSRVSLDVRPGEHVALCGPSGSGKSTLARIVALLDPPEEGEVVLDGEPIRATGLRLVPRDVRQQVALLWQSPRTAADPRLALAALVTEPLCSGGRRHRPPRGLRGAAAAGLPGADVDRTSRLPDVRRAHLDAGRVHAGSPSRDHRR